MDGHSLLFFLLANVIIFSVKSDNVTFKNVTLHNYEVVIVIEESNSLKEHLPDKNLGHLWVEGEIPVLYKNSVADIKTVSRLEFVGNNITKIEPGSFKNLQSVKELYVNKNYLLTKIESGVFENLPVNVLKVTHCHIKTISKGAFKNLPKLLYLNLSDNKIEGLEEGVFDNLENLHHLDLSYNQITSLPDGFFRNLPKLSRCHLETNKLGELKREIFENSQITDIDLSNNSISTLHGDFFTLPKLRRIKLNYNHLKTIPKGVFNNQNLDEIFISDNEISFIDSEAFDNMSLLENINLGYNKLSKYDPRWFHNTPNISRLCLTSNQIEEIPDEAFKNIYNNKGQWIDLNNNQIHKIAPQAFKGFKKILSLNLVNNKINRWDDNLLADAETVRYLNLQSNKIVCPEGDFDKIFKAQFTYLAYNELSEDCIKRINEWVISHPENKVCPDVCLLS